VEIDEIDGQLKKAEGAIGKAQELTAKHRAKLAGLCDAAAIEETALHGAAKNGNGNRRGFLSEFREV
jgi:hypothetical protein